MSDLKIKAIRQLGYTGGLSIKNDVVTFQSDENVPSKSAIQAKLTELQTAEPMRVLRKERNQKLAQTDWWCASDRNPTQAQLDYRTALRDLPANSTPSLDENGQLTGVEWPNKPE